MTSVSFANEARSEAVIWFRLALVSSILSLLAAIGITAWSAVKGDGAWLYNAFLSLGPAFILWGVTSRHPVGLNLLELVCYAGASLFLGLSWGGIHLMSGVPFAGFAVLAHTIHNENVRKLED